MRLFLYNYAEDGNWEVTRDREIFGVLQDGTGTADKAIRNLTLGDIVIVRDSTSDWPDCRIFGSCIITGEMVRQRTDKSLCEDLLWCDERKKRDIIYPFRWRVSIKGAPIIGRSRVPWSELDRARLKDTDGDIIEGRAALQMKFRGNLIDSPSEVRALCEQFWMKVPSSSADK